MRKQRLHEEVSKATDLRTDPNEQIRVNHLLANTKAGLSSAHKRLSKPQGDRRVTAASCEQEEEVR